MTRAPLAALLLILAASAPARAGDPAAGERVFNRCRACHQVGEGAKNLIGPHLNGLIGRHSGSVEGYNYTAANKNSGIVWTEEEFGKYIRDPKGVIPGTKMAFAGLKKDSEVEDITAYLKQFGPEGKKTAAP